MSRTFTPACLRDRSLPDLRSLFARAQRDLVQSVPGSQGRRAALINLDVISLAIARRMADRGSSRGCPSMR